MMLSLFRRQAPLVQPDEPAEKIIDQIEVRELAESLQRDTSGLGCEAAYLRGGLEDATAVANHQTQTLSALICQLQDIAASQDQIHQETEKGMASMQTARGTVARIGMEVGEVQQTLRQVSGAAQQIAQVALQTRLVAFNASVEAKRAGEAGAGFSVVADAVKDLSTQVESISKTIMSTIHSLDDRIQSLAGELTGSAENETTERATFHRALHGVEEGVQLICKAADASRALSDGIHAQVQELERDVEQARKELQDAYRRSDAVLTVSERLMEMIATSGVQTSDTPYIELVQRIAAEVGQTLEQAVKDGRISIERLFDEHYITVPGTQPVQHTTQFNELLDAVLPPLQESAVGALPDVIFCIAADRNGYISTHNHVYCQPQRPGDVAWNTANSRWRRIFNDRTGLASARNRRPFLLQTYRRDMGGGRYVMLKEVAAPIFVQDRHWGGLRLAYRF